MANIENRAVAVYDINTQSFLAKRDDHAMNHPDDRPFLCEAGLRLYRYLHPLHGTDKQDYKLVYNHRAGRGDGQYVRFIHQLQLFELDRHGNSWLLLIISK